VQELRVDGGAAANDSLMQFQSDILGVPVVRPAVTETTALGAAYLAGLAVGFWKTDLDATSATKDRRFEPQMAASQARLLRNRWNEAVSRAKNWEQGASGGKQRRRPRRLSGGRPRPPRR
jgi:glycerol kinase